MPRPCAVVDYVGFYARRAFALCGCHGLVPWYFTFASSERRLAASVSDHGTRPWHQKTKECCGCVDATVSTTAQGRGIENTAVQSTFFSFVPLDGVIFSPV